MCSLLHFGSAFAVVYEGSFGLPLTDVLAHQCLWMEHKLAKCYQQPTLRAVGGFGQGTKWHLPHSQELLAK